MSGLKSCQVVLAILAVVGSVTGNWENASNAGKSRDCLGMDMDSVLQEMILTIRLRNKIHQCVTPHSLTSTVDEFHKANTSEQYQMAVMGFCQKAPLYNECTNDQINIARHCLTQKHIWERLEMESRFIKLLVEVMCKQDGARVVNILMDENPRSVSSNYIAEKCFKHIKRIVLRDVFIPRQYNVQQYQLLTYFRECIFEQDTKFNDFIELLDEARERLTCVDPYQGTVGPCKNIVDRECPVQSQGNENIKIVTRFLKKTLECYVGQEMDANHSHNLQSVGQTDLRFFFDPVCKDYHKKANCFNDVHLLAGFCLRGSSLGIFHGYAYHLRSLQEFYCRKKSNQTSISTVFSNMQNTLDVNDDFEKTCSMATLDGLNYEGKEYSDVGLVLYHRLVNYKKCLEEYGRQHSTAVVEAAAILGEAMTWLLCRNDTPGLSYSRCISIRE